MTQDSRLKKILGSSDTRLIILLVLELRAFCDADTWSYKKIATSGVLHFTTSVLAKRGLACGTFQSDTFQTKFASLMS